ncbi:MAG TPA: L-threonylcarbamoyladenylate synthase [Gemmatimonadales bacterium]|nr:L-threonylcarbamoyladenylate synthase [Gemmatimonadales bacterium]
MEILRVHAAAPDPAVIARAARVLREGGLVAFPTETVYGLGANALDARAVSGIFEAKGRPAFNPLIVHVADAAAARALVAHWPAHAETLAAQFWPGPLTLVLPKAAAIPHIVTGGLDDVAVRVPAHPVALALLRECGLPIAAPSANRSTEISPTTAEHVTKALGDRIALVLDGGPTTVGIESTVVDLAGDRARLLRPGMVTVRELEAALGPLDRRPEPSASAPRAPGQLARHYAPRARLVVCRPEEGARVLEASVLRPTGAIVVTARHWRADHVETLPADPAGYAARLYAALHALDDAGCRIIVAEALPEAPGWMALQDRLMRAAHQGASGDAR